VEIKIVSRRTILKHEAFPSRNDQAPSKLRKKGHLPSTYVDARKLLWYTLSTSPPNLLGLDNDSCEIRVEIIS
jgi:hypothetical protein